MDNAQKQRIAEQKASDVIGFATLRIISLETDLLAATEELTALRAQVAELTPKPPDLPKE